MSDATAQPAGPDPTPDPHAVQVVDGDWACVKCSYALKGLSIAGTCPECGTPVADTPRPVPLREAPKDYVRTLLGGVSMMLDGLILLILVALAGLVILALVGPFGGAVLVVVLVCTGLSAVPVLLGAWRYVAKNPVQTGEDHSGPARVRVRISVGLLGGLMVLAAGLVLARVAISDDGFPSTGVLLTMLMLVTLLFVGAAVWLFHTANVMLYTAALVQRIPDDAIRRRAERYARILPIVYVLGAFVLIGPLVALLLYGALLERVRRRLRAIVDAHEPAQVGRRPG